MSLLGVHLTVLIGPTVAVPAPPLLTETLQSVEVTHNDEGRSGFQMTFQAGRSGPSDVLDYPLLTNPLLKPFNRVILIVTFNATPRVLMDGVITNEQLQPSNEPGASILTVTGEDISMMMDMEEKKVEHPGQPDSLIATKIILSYPQYGLIPSVIPPPTIDAPTPVERTPVQTATDLRYIQTLAARYGYVFYVVPGPLPFMNTAYWGPPIRSGGPQRALSINMGPDTNTTSINFQHDALAPVMVFGFVKDRQTNLTLPVATFTGSRLPLASQPALTNARKLPPQDIEGLTYLQAFARAQGKTDSSLERVITAQGELDALRYGDLLQPRALVGLRGAGYSYDGLYYVKSVTHNIRKGEYKQRFTLTREGVGSTTPVVIP